MTSTASTATFGSGESRRIMMPDLAEVRGQESAKRALEIAAAGGHSLLFLGPPGSGKTMLAQRLPGILPPLAPEEAMEVKRIYAAAAVEPAAGRPFRRPSTRITPAGLVGGGSSSRPGEASLAHHGVLFLDELRAFRRDTLEALLQPLEEGFVTLGRTRRSFPARFSLLATLSTGPSELPGDSRLKRWRVSETLLDRIDLHVEVPAISFPELRSAGGEDSAAVALRVAAARAIQRERIGPACPIPVNAAMGPEAVGRFCQLDPAGRSLLSRVFDAHVLSARAVDGILKVARTLADLAGSSAVQPVHLAEAVQYRRSGLARWSGR